MTEYKPNVKNLKYIVEKAYVAATGEDINEETRKRLYAGVDAMSRLYEENPRAFYAVAAASLAEGANAFGIKTEVIPMLVNYLVKKSGINNKDNYGGK